MFIRDCLQRLFVVSPNITQLRSLDSNFAIDLGIARLPCGEAVNVAVEHAKRGRDQYGVVDFFVGRALLASAVDVRGCDLLAALLNFASDGKQRFHFAGDRGRLEVELHIVHQFLVIAEAVSGHSTMSVLTELAIVLR